MLSLRKISTAILALTLALSLGACSGTPAEPEGGSVAQMDAEVPEEEGSVQQEDVAGFFSKLDSPYDYDYGVFTMRKAGMKFDVPKTWTVDVRNSRCVTLRTPETDGYIPSVDIVILADYGDEISPDRNDVRTHAYYFSRYFEGELSGLHYKAYGGDYFLRSYEPEDQIRNTPAFAGEDHKYDVATLINDKITVMDKSGRYYANTFGMVNSYLNWNGYPICFSCLVEKEKVEDAANFLEYLISSIAPVSFKPEGYKQVSYEDFQTEVPVSYMQLTSSENIFVSPVEENQPTAGMAIGVFRIETSKDDTINAETMRKQYGTAIASYAFGDLPFSARIEEADGSDERSFTGEIYVDNASNMKPSEYAGSAYGAYMAFISDYYIVEKSGVKYMVVSMYQPCQKELGYKAGLNAAKKLRKI